MQVQDIQDQLGIELTKEANLETLMTSPNSYVLGQDEKVVGLNLSGNGLTDDQVAFLWKESSWQALNLSENKLVRLEWSEALDELIDLNLSENANLRSVVFSKSMPKLEVLNMSECQLEEVILPAGFGQLKKLFLQKNQLAKIVIAGEHSSLNFIDASQNKLRELSLPSSLPTLEYLYLQGGNQIRDVSFLSSALQLKTVNLSGTAVQDLTPIRHLLERDIEFVWKNSGSGVLLEDCPLTTPPPEIIEKGQDAILRYFERLQKAKKTAFLYEAKVLLIGRTGAGKTSLRYKLKDSNKPMPAEDESTKGIDVEKIKFTMANGQEFHMNVWDFEGQQISHQTHQFFLTKRSLYVFVADQRTEKQDFDYWFQIVELLSDSSPLMIFHNEKKGSICDLNLDGIRKPFGHFIRPEEHRVNLNYIGAGDNFQANHLSVFQEFREALAQGLQSLPIVGIKLDQSWIKIRAEVERRSRQIAHIKSSELWAICEEYGVTDKEDQKDLSSLFHDLGVFLHYQDEHAPSLLNRMVILQDDWATKAVYMVLKSDRLKQVNRGNFTLNDLREVWKGTDYLAHTEELLELMMKFELCYKVGNTKVYIAPQLLPASPPEDYSFPVENLALLRYSYDFMPKGVITRLTVRLHPFIANKQRMAWKDGFVVEIPHAQAEIVETYGKREIHIRAAGQNRMKLINQIAFAIDELNKEYHFSDRIQAFKLIPCNCAACLTSDKPHFFKHIELVNWKNGGWTQVPCGVSGKPASVNDLLSYVLEGEYEGKMDLRRLHAKVDSIIVDQEKVFTSLSILMDQNSEIILLLDDDRVNTNRLQVYLQEIETKLNGLLIEFPQMKELSAYKKLQEQINPKLDVKGKFKVTWSLLPGILEDLIPFMPNIKYEKEVSADLKDWIGRVVQDFRNGVILLEPKPLKGIEEPSKDENE